MTDRTTDLIIQITPTVVKDNYTGILKRQDMIELEETVIQLKEIDSDEAETESQEEEKSNEE